MVHSAFDEFLELSSLASQAGFAAVHVTAVNKSARQNAADTGAKSGDKASSKCHCCTM